jgi:hypothetical protein
MSISFNITEEALASANSSSYEPVPAGSYNATIFDVKSETVKSGPNEGKPRFNIQFRIAEGQNENRRVFGYVALYVGNDFWKTQSFFSALGYDMKSGKFTVPDVNDLLGSKIGIRVKIGTDQNGQPRNEIGGFDKPTNSTAAGGADALKAMGAKPVDVF